MAEEVSKNSNVEQGGDMETSTDRGLFDFMKKKEEEHKEEKMATEFDEKVNVSCDKKEEEADEKKKHGVGGLVEKFHRSDSSSSSSSDEEGDDEEKKKRKKERKEKKGLKDKLKEKLPGHKEEDTTVPIEKCDDKPHHPHVEEVVHTEASHPTENQEDKKGLLDKIKEKLPGQQKKAANEHDSAACHAAPVTTPPPVAHAAEPCTEGEAKEKKGFLDKIKEKIPGFHSKNGEEEKKEEKRDVEST